MCTVPVFKSNQTDLTAQGRLYQINPALDNDWRKEHVSMFVVVD